jgi:hypothetical protein
MNILNNVFGAMGLSQGNLVRNAMKFVGLPEGLTSAVGLVLDVKNGNIASALFKTGPALLQALSGGQAGQANSTDRPSSIVGTGLKVAGFAALAAVAAPLLLGGSAVAGSALSGLSGMLKGGMGIAAALGFGAIAGGGGKMLFDMVGLGGFGSGAGGETKTLLGQSRTMQGVGSGSALAALPTPAMFEDIVAAFMVDFVKDKQDEIEGKLNKLRQAAQNDGKTAGDKADGFFGGILRNIPLVGSLFGGGQDAAKSGNSESRNIEFEMLKNEMQKLSQMQQAMSNVLNEMHNMAKNAIQNIR